MSSGVDNEEWFVRHTDVIKDNCLSLFMQLQKETGAAPYKYTTWPTLPELAARMEQPLGFLLLNPSKVWTGLLSHSHSRTFLRFCLAGCCLLELISQPTSRR